MNTNAQANLEQLSALLRQGEVPALEFKRSTGVGTFKVRAGSTTRVEIPFEYTIPDKPRSSKQKYRLTEKGRKVLHEQTGGGK
jgi:ATP-dependent DNA helicase RecG